jgi:hypothetical protein
LPEKESEAGNLSALGSMIRGAVETVEPKLHEAGRAKREVPVAHGPLLLQPGANPKSIDDQLARTLTGGPNKFCGSIDLRGVNVISRTQMEDLLGSLRDNASHVMGGMWPIEFLEAYVLPEPPRVHLSEEAYIPVLMLLARMRSGAKEMGARSGRAIDDVIADDDAERRRYGVPTYAHQMSSDREAILRAAEANVTDFRERESVVRSQIAALIERLGPQSPDIVADTNTLLIASGLAKLPGT